MRTWGTRMMLLRLCRRSNVCHISASKSAPERSVYPTWTTSAILRDYASGSPGLVKPNRVAMFGVFWSALFCVPGSSYYEMLHPLQWSEANFRDDQMRVKNPPQSRKILPIPFSHVKRAYLTLYFHSRSGGINFIKFAVFEIRGCPGPSRPPSFFYFFLYDNPPPTQLVSCSLWSSDSFLLLRVRSSDATS
jgi:hypothetical protein